MAGSVRGMGPRGLQMEGSPWNCIRFDTSSPSSERSTSRGRRKNAMSRSQHCHAPFRSSRRSWAGELFRRERNLTHLTSFGQTVKPELQQCYELSQRAKTVAREFFREGQAPLTIALARTVEMEALSTIFAELTKAFPKIEIRMSCNPAHEIGEKLKSGEVELAISGPLEAEWDRLETRKLYEQRFGLLLNSYHRLSGRNQVESGRPGRRTASELPSMQDQRAVDQDAEAAWGSERHPSGCRGD